MLIYIRHGETNLNKDKGGSEERLRGWLPVGLTPKGVEQAQQIADSLRGVDHGSFHTSDLPRALETAAHIARVTGKEPAPTFSLRDWHTGSLAGQKFDDVRDHLFHLIDNPDVQAPEGESLNSYLGRFIPFVSKLIESPDTHVAVGHARGTQVLQALAKNNGQWITSDSLKEKPIVDPGGRLIIGSDWTTIPSTKD